MPFYLYTFLFFLCLMKDLYLPKTENHPGLTRSNCGSAGILIHKNFRKPIPKFPAQIEDITLILPQRTLAGEVMQTIKSIHKNISEIQLKDVFKNSYTFRIWYQDPKKTLEDKEVESIREILLREVKRIYEAIPKV